MQLPEPEDEDDVRMLENIRVLGWGAIHVEGDADGPGFSFSVGFYHTWQHPEMLIMGLDVEKAHAILALAAEEVEGGRRYLGGELSDDFLKGYACRLHQIPRESYPDYLGYARWLYSGDDFPALQILWPDRAGRFPGEDDFAMAANQHLVQPGQPWPFDQPPNAWVITTRHVVEGNWIDLAARDHENGGWQVHSHEPTNPDVGDGAVISLAQLLRLDPTLAQLADLPPGWRASRETPGGPWYRRPDFPWSEN